MNKKKKFWSAVMITALVALILVLCYLAWYMYQDYLARRHAQEVQDLVTISSSSAEETVTPEPTPTEEPEKEVPEVIAEATPTPEIEGDEQGKIGETTEVPDSVFVDMANPIDFSALNSINPDLYAWVQVDDTNINYPIAQRANDDGFYLHHDMYGEPVFAGCIYTESCNSTDWTDPMTIVYGHNMRNETMFHDLHKFADQSFFDSHKYFYVYSADTIRVYEIFAAFAYDDRRTLDSFDLNNPEVFQQYIDGVKNGTVDGYQGGLARQETPVTGSSRVVTLQTCVGTGETSRFLVQGVLVSEGGKVVE